MGPSQSHGVCPPLLRADERVPVPPHRRVSAREPARGRGAAGAAGARVLARRVTVAVILAGVLAVAAWLLWRSSLPAYHLPHLDESTLFPAAALHRAQHFSSVERLFWLGKTLTQLVVLALFARWGVRWMRESAAGPIGTGMLL